MFAAAAIGAAAAHTYKVDFMYNFICAAIHRHANTHRHTQTALRHTFGSSYCMACNLFVCPAAAHREKSLQISQYKFCTLTFIRPVAHSPIPFDFCLATLARLPNIATRRRRQELLRQLHVKLTQLCMAVAPGPPTPAHSAQPTIAPAIVCSCTHFCAVFA